MRNLGNYRSELFNRLTVSFTHRAATEILDRNYRIVERCCRLQISVRICLEAIEAAETEYYGNVI